MFRFWLLQVLVYVWVRLFCSGVLRLLVGRWFSVWLKWCCCQVVRFVGLMCSYICQIEFVFLFGSVYGLWVCCSWQILKNCVRLMEQCSQVLLLMVRLGNFLGVCLVQVMWMVVGIWFVVWVVDGQVWWVVICWLMFICLIYQVLVCWNRLNFVFVVVLFMFCSV